MSELPLALKAFVVSVHFFQSWHLKEAATYDRHDKQAGSTSLPLFLPPFAACTWQIVCRNPTQAPRPVVVALVVLVAAPGIIAVALSLGVEDGKHDAMMQVEAR